MTDYNFLMDISVGSDKMKEFRIIVSQEREGLWMADATNLPGSPPVGYGKTRLDAIGSLMIELSKDETYRHKYHNIIVVIK